METETKGDVWRGVSYKKMNRHAQIGNRMSTNDCYFVRHIEKLYI